MSVDYVRLMLGASSLSLIAATGAAPAFAQTTASVTADQAGQQDTSADDIIVTGVRASLSSAQALKRNSNQIVDSVQAQDIGKLPDANTVEALQRITGVQVQRRYGEGATDFDHRTQPAITVRGLTQVQNLLDGRAVYSASGGRAFDIEGIPPELLAGIDVFKNPPASIVEGGIGGAVNLRTRLPFDSAKQIISATVRGTYYDRGENYGGSVSGLYSNRFETGAGEFGILINAVYGKSKYQQDAILVGQQSAVPAGSIAGAPANARIPLGFQIYDDKGDRERIAVAGAVQWQASPDVLVTGQIQRADYKFYRDGTYFYPINNSSVPSPAAGATFAFDKAGYATRGAISNQMYESGRFDQDLSSDSTNYTFNVKWDATDRLKATFDAQYLKSHYNADRDGFVLSQYDRVGDNGFTAANRTTVDFDLTGKRPVWNVANPGQLTDQNRYTIPFVADSLTRNEADQLALAYDLEYDNEGSFLAKLRGGVRYTDSSIDLRGTWNGVCLYANIPARGACDAPNGTALPRLSANPDLSTRGPTPGFFDGRTLPNGVLYSQLKPGSELWQRIKDTYAVFGIQPRDTFLPADLNSQTERTLASYAAADYATDVDGVRIDGNIGIRLIRTQLTSSGTQFNANGTSAPISVDKSYVSALPSANVRARFTDTFQVRLAYSKAIARPNFDQLSTNLSLNAANQINPITGRPSASSGNPGLDPIKSDNYDVTAEWYFASAGSLTGGLFYKKARGFLAGGTEVRTYNGREYDTSTVLNTGNGEVKGFEIAYQQFFDFLPGLLSGFGFQANYTYADSNVTNPFSGPGSPLPRQVPLEKLSKNSYNLIGLYEKGPVTARVAWNWRGAYFDTTSGSGANGQLQFNSPYASLDASISVNLNKNIALSIDAVNLNNRMNVTYIDTPNQPLQYTLNDRRFGASLRATF